MQWPRLGLMQTDVAVHSCHFIGSKSSTARASCTYVARRNRPVICQCCRHPQTNVSRIKFALSRAQRCGPSVSIPPPSEPHARTTGRPTACRGAVHEVADAAVSCLRGSGHSFTRFTLLSYQHCPRLYTSHPSSTQQPPTTTPSTVPQNGPHFPPAAHHPFRRRRRRRLLRLPNLPLEQ